MDYAVLMLFQILRSGVDVSLWRLTSPPYVGEAVIPNEAAIDRSLDAILVCGSDERA